MKADDLRQERMLAALTRLLPDPDQRDFPAGREQVLKEHLVREFRSARENAAAGHPRTRPGYPKRTVWSAVAGASALAVAVAAVGLIYLTGNASHSVRPGHTQASHLTAAQFLDKIAHAAASQPGPQVHGSTCTAAPRCSRARPRCALPLRPLRLPRAAPGRNTTRYFRAGK